MTYPFKIGTLVALAPMTTYRIGGNAMFFADGTSVEQVGQLLDWAQQRQIPVFVLGKGSNLLISDKGWPGLVLRIALENENCAPVWKDNSVVCSAGLSLNTLVKDVADHGFWGMEKLAGIPGTVGGAVIMNAGAFSSCIADTLERVTCIRQSTREVVEIDAVNLSLGYRTSILQASGDIVLRAQFHFSRRESPATIEGIRKEILMKRKQKQPLDYPNCGSVFKRPLGNFAGTLIEQCGLKGLRCGDAEVSQKHANFIINTGSARAGDVRHLICMIQQRVYEQYGILLEPEVIFVGEFEESLYVPPGEKA